MFWSGLILGLLIGGIVMAAFGVRQYAKGFADGKREAHDPSEDRFQLGVDWANAQHREARRQAGLKASATRKAKGVGDAR